MWPDNETARTGLLSILSESDPATAESRLQEWVQSRPRDAAAQSALGNLLGRQGRWADALGPLTLAQSLAPERAAHAYNLAVALDQARRYDEALRMYRQALQIGGTGVSPSKPWSAAWTTCRSCCAMNATAACRRTHRLAAAARCGLGDRLQHMGLVSADQIQIALLEQRKTGKQLGDALIALGFVTEEAMREALGQTLGQQTIQLQTVLADSQALARLPKAMALRFQVFPVSFQPEAQKLVLASPKPNDIIAGDQIRAHVGLGVSISWRLASAADVLAAIDQFYGYELSIDGIIQEIETGQIDMASLSQGQGGYSHPVVRLVDALLSDAVHKLASDIHFEPEGQFLRIRYRIDGVLRQVRVLHGRYWSAMLVRLKLVAGMNIAESRAPQDGRVSLSIGGRNVDFRAAVQPTIHGENFVLRVLDAKRGIVDYDKLGLTDDQYHLLNLMLARPEGIILVTGPTGSGKTTTLYSVLSHMNDESVNIMTLEDPVEYPITRIRQTSISDGSKINFSDGCALHDAPGSGHHPGG